MDLSKLKWPLIIVAVIAVWWLMSNPGVNFMYNKFTQEAPGADPVKDKANEAGLSRLGGFCLKTFRYEKAYGIFSECITRYPQGANAKYNYYRMAKCAEKMGRIQESIKILRQLQEGNAHELDDRVPEPSNLKLRADKLMEMHNLGEIQGT